MTVKKLQNLLVTPDALNFAPRRYVAYPPIPCRTCGGEQHLRNISTAHAEMEADCPDCTDGTEPLTECLIATPGTGCQWCFGRGFFTDNENDYSQTTRCLSGCTNGQRPGVVLGRATFGAGLPIVEHDSDRALSFDSGVFIVNPPHGSWRKIEVSSDDKGSSSLVTIIDPANRLGDWAVGNVAYPIESYTLVTDPGGCPACHGDPEQCLDHGDRDAFLQFCFDDGDLDPTSQTASEEWSRHVDDTRCGTCDGLGHLTAPWSPPWLPTEPGVHRVEIDEI